MSNPYQTFWKKAVKFHRTTFERQISESVQIQNNRGDKLLNSRAEFNRCALPRLALKMGEKAFEQMEKEKDEEQKEDELIEYKIREMRKKRNMERRSRRGLNMAPLQKRPKREKEVIATEKNR